MSAPRILIAAGGTGGHLFPAVAVAKALQEKHPDCCIEFIGTLSGIEKDVIPELSYKLHLIPACKFYRMPPLKRATNFLKLIWAVGKSAWVILRFNPRAIIGTGSYTAAPEQNASPGITNRIAAKYADISLLAYEPTSKRLYKRYEVVGNPIRHEIHKLSEYPVVLPEGRLHIYIIGGSQGAHILNIMLGECLPMLEKYADKIQLTHQTGKTGYDYVSAYAQKASFPYVVTPFIKDMQNAYQNASLIISRAGSIVNEFLAAGQASVLVPIAKSSGNHQKSNADALSNNGAAITIEEKHLTPQHLFETLEKIITDPETLKSMSDSARALYKSHSASRAADVISRFFLQKK
ncbi:hypothetical protein CHS0354_006876 [Potamilus streckersoni]|uniref:Undecaprenyldiphospho-muramoylpentapeptide beta-N-acetylglucosaminyltransferase n=1 Tax=Potamilus streckersoni TaxID=2493646 RepID=A0AAE0WD04_9BIVA|nr:hypothetical protein CHS0354_006876 [Potamilus streckersoni]